MNDPAAFVETLVRWLQCTLAALGPLTLLFGAFSAAAPSRSIRLYEWMMERFNWRVRPIDERRELRTTRGLGLLLVGLSLVLLWRLACV